MRARHEVTIRQNGERVVLDRVRRLNGAMTLLDAHVVSKRQAEAT